MNDMLSLSLPHIAADLMISGVPIELMDGDVSYVPLRWVAAVFDKLSENLGNKQLFCSLCPWPAEFREVHPAECPFWAAVHCQCWQVYLRGLHAASESGGDIHS